MNPPPNKGGILITGASSGIGRAAAIHFAKQGHLVFAGIRNPADADALRREHVEGTLHPLPLDITNPAQIALAADTVRQVLGNTGMPLLGLVNNAGIVVGGPLECLPIDDLRRQFEINVFGHVAVTQAFIEMLRPSAENPHGGRIVTLSSIAGRNTLPFVSPYSASKFALNALFEALRMELAPWRIHVALIEPGSIDTPIWEKSMAAARQSVAGYAPEKLLHYKTALEKTRDASKNAARRGIQPDAVVRAIDHALFAGKPKNRYLVGRDAHVRARFALLPDWLKERLILRKLGISP